MRPLCSNGHSAPRGAPTCPRTVSPISQSAPMSRPLSCPPGVCPTCASPTATGESGQACGSVWALIKQALVMNELVRRVCMTMELPNYGFDLIMLSPLHAISMCQAGRAPVGAVPSPHPSTHQGGCTAPAMPKPGPHCPVPRVWGQQCQQRQPGVAAPPQGPSLPAWGLPAQAPSAGLPSPGTHRASSLSAPWHTQSPVPRQPRVPTEPHRPSPQTQHTCRTHAKPCQPPISSTAWGEGSVLASSQWGTRGAPPAQPGTGMVCGGRDQPSPTCWGCRWGPEPKGAKEIS